MNNVLSELAHEYNRLLERERKGKAYLENESIPLEKREQWLDEFLVILRTLSDLTDAIQKELGREMTYDEMNFGMREPKEVNHD